MFKKILVPIDGSELSEKAIACSISLAREMGSVIIFVTVNVGFHSIERGPQMLDAMPDEYQNFVHDYLSEDADKILQAARKSALKSKLICKTVCQQNNSVYQGIIDTAESLNCDLIIMASHGRSGISAVILGSDTQKVLSHSKIPVLIYR